MVMLTCLRVCHLQFAVRLCRPAIPHAGAALSSGVGMNMLQKLAFLANRALAHQLHQPVLCGTASPDHQEFGLEGSNQVQQVCDKNRLLRSCSFEMAQLVAPRLPQGLRDYLRDQQLTVNEAAVERSLSFERHSPAAVATPSHAVNAAGCNDAVQTIGCIQPHATLVQRQQAQVNPKLPLQLARSDLSGSQVSTLFSWLRMARDTAPVDSFVGDPCAHCSSPHEVSIPGER